MTIEEIQPDGKKRSEENRRLKIGYSEIYQRRYPINTDPANCESKEDAYLLHLVKTYLNIPEYLELGNIIDDIPEEHHERLINIWLKLKYHQNALEQNSASLRKKWKNPVPHAPDETAKKIVDEPTIKIQKKFRVGAIATISKSEEPELKQWKEDEKGSRRNVYLAFKNFITALRAYYEMLLETGENEDEYVLPVTKTYTRIYRDKIEERNRNLRVIDAFHQASTGSKAAHHEQGKSRLRKAENKPYVAHEMRTASATIIDVLPHAPDETGLITLIIACAIHDTVEDTNVTIDQIMEKYVKEPLNAIDSSLTPHIKPGFEKKYLKKARKIRKEKKQSHDLEEEKSMVPLLFQEDVIHLVGRYRKIIIKQILRILSKNVPLTEEERKKAYQDNIAGKKKTRELLDIRDNELKKWRLIDRDEEPKSKTFITWPDEYDEGELARLLLRLNTITISELTIKNALTVKIEDRADNVAKLKGMPADHQFKTLRTTTTRLIAWCMLDYKEHKKFPLYNALPRLIDTTLQEYERVQIEYPDLMQELDIDLIEQLTDWKREVIRFEIPAKVQKVLEEYEESKYKVRPPTPSDSQLPLPYFEP